MGLKRKYKNYNTLSLFLGKINKSRILKFKNTKWKRLKSLLLKNLKRKKINKKKLWQPKKSYFKTRKVWVSRIEAPKKKLLKKTKKSILVSNENFKIKFKFWKRISRNYKESLNLKNSLDILFGSFLTLSDYKKNIRQKKVLSNYHDFITSFIKPFFRVEILLLHLNFFTSSYEIKQMIKNNKILVNNKKIPDNYFLQEGDIITLYNCLNPNYYFFSNKKNLFYSFVEVDYYTKTIILLKNPLDIEYKDIALFYENYTSSKKLNDYIRRK